MQSPDLITRLLRRCGASDAILAAILLLATLPGHAQDPEPRTDVTLDELGAQARPTVEGAASGLVRIDFKDAPVEEVVRAISLQTGINVLLDPAVAGQKVTLVAHHPVPGDMAMDILEVVLSANNLQLTKQLDGNIYRVSQRGAPGVGPDKLPITSGKQTVLEGFERLAIHLAEVKYADATKVADVLQSVGSNEALITVYAESNWLILRDTAEGVRNMLSLLAYIDVPGTGTAVEIFTLDWTRAEMLATQVMDVLLGGDGGAADGQPGTPAIVRRQPRVAAAPGAGQAAVDVIGQDERVLRVVPDERLNALIVIASEGMMTQVRFLVEQLDRAPDTDAENIHYRQLLNADAEAVATVLESLVGSAVPQQGGQNAAATGEVQAFERNVTIAAYKETNSLLILATPQDFRRIDKMVSSLDVPRRMVSVESIIMEVTINDDWGLGVETALLEDNYFSLTNTINLANLLSGGLGTAAGALGLGGVGASLGIIDGSIDVETEGGTISVPNVPLLVRALETITDVDVLSNPNLMIVDNEEATINVGQEIPIITSLGDVDDRTGFNSRSQVQRRDTGVTLTVTPQIREGDNVAIKVDVEVSSPVRSSVGIDPNETGVTVAQSVLNTLVVVPNGKTAVIGGLIRESLNQTRNQVPVLGDVPFFGFLFRSKSKSRVKQNLAIMLTPQIVRAEADLVRISEQRVDDFYQSNLDAIFEKGFVKRVKGKNQQRKDGPVKRRSESQATTGNYSKTGTSGNE